MTIRLRIQELARARGLNMSEFQREAKLPMSTVRRIWYSTSDGSERGEPLQQINLRVLEDVAAFFGVEPGELLVRSENT